MARIEVKCPRCSKHVEVISTKRTKRLLIHRYRCGHLQFERLEVPQFQEGQKLLCLTCKVTIGRKHIKRHIGHKVVSVPSSRDHRWIDLYEYQRRGVEFIEKANFKCLIGDEMGLGKTMQAIMAFRYNRDILSPALIICPAGVIWNWQREIRSWYNDKYKELEDLPMVHTNSLMPFMDQQRIHIISNMLLSKDIIRDSLKDYGFKTVIVDESHHFKNDTAKRTKVLIDWAANVPHRILLSGTSVLNRTSEFFNTLHLVDPLGWPTIWSLNSLCMYSLEGKQLCISPNKKEFFFHKTSRYVIRRTKKELFKELPPLQENFQFINVQDNKEFVSRYNSELDKLEKLLNMSKKVLEEYGGQAAIIVLMQKLWEDTALAKVNHLIYYVKEFLENTEQENKIAIGTHHRIPRSLILKALQTWNPRLIVDQQPAIKDFEQEEFKKPENRLLIASILGAGEGRNLNFCNNVVFLERYWNRKKEEQFRDRFYCRGENPEEEKERIPVIVDYLLAANTIDEYFTEMLKLKAQITDQALNADFMVDSNSIWKLAEKVVENRLKYVGE